jgi:hypothetical protein
MGGEGDVVIVLLSWLIKGPAKSKRTPRSIVLSKDTNVMYVFYILSLTRERED